MKLVLVSFNDPTTFGHWSIKEDMEASKCKVCFAQGMLMREETDFIKVGLLCGKGGDSFSDWIVIPRGCILTCDEVGEFGFGGNDVDSS